MSGCMGFGRDDLDFTTGFSLVIFQCFFTQKTLSLFWFHKNPFSVGIGLSFECCANEFVQDPQSPTLLLSTAPLKNHRNVRLFPLLTQFFV